MKYFGFRIADCGLKKGSAPRARSPIRNPKSEIRNSPAFSLIELLVVIALIAILLAVTLPTINALTRSSRGDAGVNTIGVAVAAARAYSTRTVLSLGSTPPYNAQFPGSDYSGTAILFCPSNELRLVENSQVAIATTSSGSPATPIKLEVAGYNGYTDIPGREYITMPKRTGMMGIVRTATGLELRPPPFAIRFNKYGQLVLGDDPAADGDRIVYYDGDYDGKYQIVAGSAGSGYSRTSNPRTSPYLPGNWDPESSTYLGDGTCYSTAQKKYKLPFDAIEAVVGVLVYSKSELQSAFPTTTIGATVTSANNAAVYNWLLATDASDSTRLKNARQLFFSRYSGAVMREQ